MLHPTNELRWMETKFNYDQPLLTMTTVISQGTFKPAKHFKLQQKWDNKFKWQNPDCYKEEWRDVPFVALEEQTVNDPEKV